MRIHGTPQEFRSLFRVGRKRVKPQQDNGPHQPKSLPLMKWTQSVYQQIIREIGSRPPELGGILLGPADDLLATHFVFDKTGYGSSVSWTFGHHRINDILRQYAPLKLDMKGFVHSHPSSVNSPSPSGYQRDLRKPFDSVKNEGRQKCGPR